MTTMQWTVGDVRITKVVELEMTAPGGGEGTAVPDAHPQAVREIPWLCPDYADERGHLKISVHALLIDAPGLKLVVDTCTGNAKQRTAPLFNQLNTPFLQRFEATGWRREDVQAVLCTHLHVDHVGWNTMWVDGRWVPTFPNARYLIGRAEFAHWTQEPGRDTEALLADSVQPILDAGLVQWVETDARLSSEVRLLPTPGHTPGHVSVLIESRGQTAAITGDLMHHACQVARPQWSSGFDCSQDESRRSRHRFLSSLVDRQPLLIGTHFGGATAGTLLRDGDSYKLGPLADD